MKGVFLMDSATTTTILGNVITSNMLSGVFNELVGVLPVVIPAVISFLAVRKALSFVLGSMRRA